MYSMLVFCFFFFKQKTAYEMRISDWSSDVCSSDLDSFAQAHSEALDIAPPGAASQDSFLAVKCYLNTDIHHDAALLQGREPSLAPFVARSEERRVGKERVSTCRSRCSPSH